MSEIPATRIFYDIRPDRPDTDATPLTYSNLSAAAAEHDQLADARLARAWESESDSIEEDHAAREAALANLARTALRVVEAPNPRVHDQWAERFTESSIELFGEPDADEARKILRDHQRWVASLQANPTIDQEAVNFLLDFYEPLVGKPDHEAAASAEEKQEAQLHQEIAEIMNQRYHPLIKLFDEPKKTTFAPKDLKDISVAACAWLAEYDQQPGWSDWKVVEAPDVIFSIEQARREIVIGMLRQPSSPNRARGLFVHEVLVHAMRSVKGYASGNERLGVGLSNADEFEEGLATFIEYALSPPGKVSGCEHYISIALALGKLDGRYHNRAELLKISQAKVKIAYQDIGSYDPANNTGQSMANSRVNRIFRGGRGDDFGERQAVFTKDIIYHRGYIRARRYIQQLRDNGVRMEDILDYLTLGVFDPTNPQHREAVFYATGRELPLVG